MKAIIAALVLLILAIPAFAAPFVVADVQAGVSQCGFWVDSSPVVLVSATGTTCKLDVASVSVGAHTVTVDARSDAGSVWGVQISARSAPLNFTRPAPPAVPTGLTLTP